MKQWMMITIESCPFWPAEETTVDFMGNELILRPPDGSNAADVRMQYESPEGQLHVTETIFRFLSALAWSERCPVRTRLRISCTAPTLRGAKGNGDLILCPGFVPSGLSIPGDPKARLATAIYREAQGSRDISYKFLSYFKIINIVYDNGSAQKRWINKAVSALSDKNTIDRIKELTPQQTDIGAYLYESGRCAVAHASVGPIVDPDDPRDFIRLSKDMPVIKVLAEYLMVSELGL